LLHIGFTRRGPTTSHQHDADLGNRGLVFPQSVRSLIEHVFSEQKAVYGVSDEEKLLTNRFDLLTEPWIASKFYSYDVYVLPRLRRGVGGQPIDIAGFEEVLADPGAGLDRNKLFF
jgi:hypothetical protein